MNWSDSQMASSAMSQGMGGMSLGEQWALAAFMRDAFPDNKKKNKNDKIEDSDDEVDD